jgi:hypothetical protein
MDPEEAMIEEGRRRAEAAGVANLSFVVGGSDDLERLRPALGDFAAVVMSQSFHWMSDQDAVLQTLDPMLDPQRGAVALVGYVKEPEANHAWVGIDRPPWAAVERILNKHLEGVPDGPHPRGRHDPFPDILARSAFPRTELLVHEYTRLAEPSIAAATGYLYSLSNVLARLGERRAAFEQEVDATLGDADTTPFPVRLVDSALIGTRASE